MNTIDKKIDLWADDVIKDNNFLFVAYQNRLCLRLFLKNIKYQLIRK